MSTCPAPNPRGMMSGRLRGVRRAVTTTDQVVTAGPAAANPPRPSARRHVALVVETSLASGREILQGVARYVQSHGGWSTFVEARSLEDVVPSWLATWRGDGIIARVPDPAMARAVTASGIPVVDVLGPGFDHGLPTVHTDDARIGAMAAEHLTDMGVRHFAFVGLTGEAWSERRREACRRAVAPRARSWDARDIPREAIGPSRTHVAELSAWIAGLPKPVGLVLCSDQCGPAILDACRRAGVDVPDDVAVIGVDDDEPLCELADPGLSSVWPDHTQVGYEAAALLDRLMRGGEAPAGPVVVPPRGVVARRSSDALAFDDCEVAAAVRVIRSRACDLDGLTIDDVAAEVSVSRSVLQRRFRHATGRTLHEEMLRVRLARARSLLSETDLPIAVVAEKAGFRHPEYMGAVFRQKVGATPAQYRRQRRD